MKKILLIIIVLLCFLIIIYNYDESNKNIINSSFLIYCYKDGSLNKQGTGFVYKVSDYVYILTNYHVISNSDDVYILIDDEKIKLNLVNYNEYYDIAILKFKNNNIVDYYNISKLNDKVLNSKLKYVDCYYKDCKIVDDIVFDSYVTLKIKYDNEIKKIDLMKFNGSVDVGNSGSPILDKDNNVIGIVTMDSIDEDNVIYAISLDIINDLENDRLLNLDLDYVFSKKNDLVIYSGFVVDSIFSSYLIKNDVISEVDDKKINDIYDLEYLIYKHKKGELIKFKIKRNNDYYIYNIMLN